MACSLCERSELTVLLYEDEVCWVTYCSNSNHPDKLMVVLNRHAALPTPMEYEHIYKLFRTKYGHLQWRSAGVILDHFHIHEVHE